MEVRNRNAVERGSAVWLWQARPFIREAVARAGGYVELGRRSGVGERTLRTLLSPESFRLGADAPVIDITTLDKIVLADGWTCLAVAFPLPEAA